MASSIHTFLRVVVVAVCGTLTITAQTQQPNCGCQCTCETCNCQKPAPKAGGHWVWVEDEVNAPIKNEVDAKVTAPQRTQRSRPSTHKNEGEITLNMDNTSTTQPHNVVSPGKNKGKISQTKNNTVTHQERNAVPSGETKGKSEKDSKPLQDNKGRPIVKSEKIESNMTPEEEALLRELTEGDMSKYGLVQYIDTIARYKWVDDEIIDAEEDLMEYVKHQGKRYLPAAASMDHNQNGAFLYFDEKVDGTAGPLHMRIQYCSKDPLLYNDVDFQIDYMPASADDRRCTYNIRPENIDRGSMGKMSWETSDNIMSGNDDKDLLYALAHCNWAQLTLKAGKSDKIVHKQLLTEDQLRDFYVMLQLFRIKGGVF